jgi:hypothetical protein
VRPNKLGPITTALLVGCAPLPGEPPGDAAVPGHGAGDLAAAGDRGPRGDAAGDPGGDPRPAPDGGDAGGGEPAPSGDAGDFDPGGDATIGCEIAGVAGICLDAGDCAGESIAGYCPGPANIRCCIDDLITCSVSGAPGVCIDIGECTDDWSPTPGYCPGPANIQCCTETGAACDPSAVPLPNEGLVEEAWDLACPLGMVPVTDFCIDRYEASLVWLDQSGVPISSWSPYFSPGDERVTAVSVRDAVPQGYISGEQAAAACSEAGKRLCTNAEWLRACQGASGFTYPYGATRQDGVCNDARAAHPVIEYFGTNEAWIWSELDHPCINQLPDSVHLTGQNDGCVREDGARDMMGNLHEWTSDPNGTFRGGYYVDTRINGNGCLYATTAHNIYHWDYSTGFRCCIQK